MNNNVNNPNVNNNVVPNMAPNVNNNPVQNNNMGSGAMNPQMAQSELNAPMQNGGMPVQGGMPNGQPGMMGQPMPPVNNGQVTNNQNIVPPNGGSQSNSIQDKFKTILKGMFNFGNINKLLKYEWASMVETTMPKDTKEVIDKPSYDNIMYGGILKVIADLMAILFAVGMVYVLDTLDPAKVNGLRTLGLKNDVGITAIIPVAITLIIFTYNCAIGYQQQKTTFHFAFIWMIFLSTIFSLINLVSYIAALFIAPLYGLLGMTSFVFALLGNVSVVVGCVDFCKRVTKNYIDAHTVAPTQGPITMTAINVDDISDHNHKTCPQCGNQVSSSLTTCNFCGNNL